MIWIYIGILVIIVLCILLYILGIVFENKVWNKGICPKCGKGKWTYIKTVDDEDLYRCDFCDHEVRFRKGINKEDL